MLINGRSQNCLSPLDRGLSYGDGLFETIRFTGDRAPLWERHMARLVEGCRRLRIAEPDVRQLLNEALQVCDGLEQAVLRITLTRGLGERGYAFSIDGEPTRVVTAFPMPDMSPSLYVEGVRLYSCHTALADQPLLAGIKHLNRLEQVLARAEWRDPSLYEGLVGDQHGHVISATAANLFAVVDGKLLTPAVDRCGVAGVARAAVLEAMPDCQVRDLTFDECQRATELFLSSSIRGILPVQSVGDTVYAPGPVTRVMQSHWRNLGFPVEQA